MSFEYLKVALIKKRLKRTNKFAVIPIPEAEKLLAAAHASNDPTQPPQPDSAHGLFLAETMQRTFTLLPLHSQDGPSTHWMLATIEVPPDSNIPHVSMWNSLPGRCFAKARYALNRLPQPLGVSPTFSQPRSRGQPPFLNDSGPISFYNAARQAYFAKTGDALPFPANLRLRMSLLTAPAYTILGPNNL